jgi:FtsP/CotA-like multicopper oxidase with cupredoxin domain
MAPDGFPRQMLTFNGQYPGPTIEANWGDEVIVHIKNNLQNNGYSSPTSQFLTGRTAIHWHGILQEHNVANDGVPGVSQCPIPPGEWFTYRFRATSYGQSWYHSHFSLQYTDGLVGPIVVYGPSSANWDVDLGPVSITDWFHTSAFQEYFIQLQFGNPPVGADNGLINGRNMFNGSGEYSQFKFEKGKRYRMRLINTSTNTHFKFWIDQHVMTVQGSDFVAIQPYQTEVLNIAIGIPKFSLQADVGRTTI